MSTKLKRTTKKLPKLPYVIIRSTNAGVFAGTLKSRKGDEVILETARRLWYWDGAASLSQLAIEGVTRPVNCKFSVHTNDHTVLGVIEIIPTSGKAQDCIEGVPVWRG